MYRFLKYTCLALCLFLPFGAHSSTGLKDFEFAKVLITEEEWAAAMNFFGLAISDGVLNKRQTAEAYHLRGVSRGKLNKHRLALRDHKRAIKLLPDYVAAWSSVCYQNMANAKDLDAAMAACDKALALNPKHAPSYALRAEVWHGQGDNQRAEADFAQSLRIDPENWGVHYNRAIFYHNIQQPAKAKASFTKAYLLASDWQRSRMAATKVFRSHGIKH